MTQSRYALSQQAREIRRYNILNLISTGNTSHRNIAEQLNVSIRTVDRDVIYWTQCADIDMKNHFKSLPLEIKKCTAGLDLTIKTLTDIIDSEDTETDLKLAALNSRMHAYRFKMEILDGKANLKQVFTFIEQSKNDIGVIQTKTTIQQ